MFIQFAFNMAGMNWLQRTHDRPVSFSGEVTCVSLIADTPSSDLLRYFRR